MKKNKKIIRDAFCVALALFELVSFSGCSKEDKSDTIPYSEYLTQKYGADEKNFHHPATFDRMQIWVTNIGNKFHENRVDITHETLFEEDGLKRINVVIHNSKEVLASILYYENENYEEVLERLKKEYGRKNGQVIFTVNYYDIVKKLFGEKNEYTDSEMCAVEVYIDDHIDLRIENIK